MATNEHVAHVQKLLAQHAGGPGFILPEVQGGRPPREPSGAQVAEQVEEVQAGAAGAAADAAAAAETEEPAEAIEKPAAKPRIGDRLRKSVEIERRAEAVRAKARADVQASKEQRARDERRGKEADQRVRQATQVSRQVQEAQRELQRTRDLLKTNPLEFARQNGLTGKDLADFVRTNADPNARRADLIESRVAAAIQNVERKAEERISKLEAQIVGERETTAQEALLEHVSGDQDRFEALNAIYSPSELLTKASDLAEQNEKLQWGWDGDRLCEELENRARKDSRWSRIQTRYAPKPKSRTAADPSRQTSASTTATEERREPPSREAAPVARRERQQMSPQARHRLHVQRLARTLKFG